MLFLSCYLKSCVERLETLCLWEMCQFTGKRYGTNFVQQVCYQYHYFSYTGPMDSLGYFVPRHESHRHKVSSFIPTTQVVFKITGELVDCICWKPAVNFDCWAFPSPHFVIRSDVKCWAVPLFLLLNATIVSLTEKKPHLLTSKFPQPLVDMPCFDQYCCLLDDCTLFDTRIYKQELRSWWRKQCANPLLCGNLNIYNHVLQM